MAVGTTLPLSRRQRAPSAADLHLRYARTRDPRLRDELLARHAPLARALARRFGPRGNQGPDDVLQVAYIGLIKAVERFDPDLGFQFSTYAARTILGELKRNLRDNGWAVRPPRSVHDLYLATEACADELTQTLRRAPTMEELAERLGVSVERLIEARETAGLRTARSIDTPVRPGEVPLSELITDATDGFEDVERRAVVARLAGRLNERERRLLTMRFVDGMTQAAIAEVLGVSQMQVSRSLRSVLGKLRSLVGDGG